MINIVVVSHGKLCSALVSSAKIITGRVQRVYSVPLLAKDSPSIYEEKLNAVLKPIERQDTLILIDVFSGTPYNVSVRHVLKDNVECITGVNLPMVIEAIMSREGATLSELAANLTEAGKDSVKNLKSMFKQ